LLSATLAGFAGVAEDNCVELCDLVGCAAGDLGEVILMTLLGGTGTFFGPVAAQQWWSLCRSISRRSSALGYGHHRRGLRRLRAHVPPWHRRHDCSAAARRALNW